MARLPGINYNTPVQKLGRDDIYGPIRVANAEAAALQSIGNLGIQVAEVMETNEVAKYSAQFSNTMSELNAQVKNQKTYGREELDTLGIKYKETYKVPDKSSPTGFTDVVRDEIPAHEVSVEYYKTKAKQAYDASSEELSRRGKKVMNKLYATKYAQGITEVREDSLKHAHQYAQLEAETNFESSVNSSDGIGAGMIADTALANGTWTPTYYASKVLPMPGRVAQRGFLIQLDEVGDPAELEKIQGEILHNPVMTAGQMSGLNKSYETKINRVNKAIEKNKLKHEEEMSSQALSQMSAELILGDLDWTSPNEVMAAITQLNKGDRRTAITIWNAERNKVKASSQDSLLEAHLLVRSTIMPDEMGASSFNQRRAVAREMITDMVKSGDITVTDYTTLLDDLNQIRSIPFKSPEYQMVEDDIYVTLTGGTKDMMGSIMPSGANAIGLADTMYELNNAALERGPEFDARRWWADKKPKILTKAIKDSTKKWNKSIESNFQVLDIHGKVDMPATIISIQAEVTNGKLSPEEGDKAIAASGVYVLQQKHLSHQLQGEEAERRLAND